MSAGFFESLSSALSITPGTSYGAIAKPGADFNHLAPPPLDIVESQAPGKIEKLQVLPSIVGQNEACQMHEDAKELDAAELATRDYVKHAKTAMDKLDAIHGHQTELASHAMKTQRKIAQRNAKYADSYMIDGYHRKMMSAGLHGTKKGLTGIQMALR